jgi:hypothetical protein
MEYVSASGIQFEVATCIATVCDFGGLQNILHLINIKNINI